MTAAEKNLYATTISLILLVSFVKLGSPRAWGRGSRSASQNVSTINDKSPECQQVENACGEAGYTQGLPPGAGKDLMSGCMEPLLNGKSVPGVSADSATVKKCASQQYSHGKGKRRRLSY